jgi:transposase
MNRKQSKKHSRDERRTILAGNRAVVGIDIGKRKHAATAVSPQGKVIARLASFPNTREGVDLLERKVLQKAGEPRKTLIAMEATGHYWMCLYHELVRRCYRCVVVNPVQTHASFRARIRKTTTDKIDSLGIARFILTGNAKATRVPDEKTTELRLLVRHRRRLVHARANMERYAGTLVDRVFPEYDGLFSKPFLPSARAMVREIGLAPEEITSHEDEVRDTLHRASRGRIAREKVDLLFQRAKRSIGSRQAESLATEQLRSVFDYTETIQRQIDEIEEQLESRIEEMDSPLMSLGINPVLAATIHAESDPIADFPGPDQYVAYTGLDPSVRESGDTIRGRSKISKRGSPVLRSALYMAAFSVYRKHDYFHRFYQKHRRKGRSHTSALVVVAHRLARVVWRLLTDNRKFTKRPPKTR